jgi:NAD(P)-dependent dehydrogenase (short-subunit alcohol dehydrogenase family)
VAPLDGKVAVITGAGQGVGHGFATALAAEGASIVAAGRTLSKCERTVAEIEAAGGRALAVHCDVKELAQIEQCVASAVEAFGRIDILINNAMEPHPPKPLLEHDEAKIAALWAAGPLATLRFMRACHPYLQRNDVHSGGVIINIGTRRGVHPDPSRFGVYAAVKEAVRTLSRAAACEWATDGIRVYTILPLANSPTLMLVQTERPDDARRYLSEVPMGRFGDPVRDIGRVAVFLCSDAAGYLTGITIPVDGGAAHIG